MKTSLHTVESAGDFVVRLIAGVMAVFSLLALVGWFFDFPIVKAFGGRVDGRTGAILAFVALAVLILSIATGYLSFKTKYRIRKQALELEAAHLREAVTTELQRGVLEGTQFGVIAFDTVGVVREFSLGAEAMLGYAKSDVIGKSYSEVFHLDQEMAARAAELSAMLGRKIEAGFEAFVAQANEGRSDEREWTYICKDSTRIPVSLSITALRNKEGAVTGYVAMVQDLTNKKKAEHALKTSEERLHRVLEHADCLVWEAKVELSEQDWNWQMTIHPSGLYRRLTSQTGTIASVGLWYQFEIPEQEEMNRRSREAMESGASNYVQEFRLLRGAQVFWIRESVAILRRETGRFWLVGVAVDITESRQAKTARDELAARLKKLGSMLPGMIYQFRRRPDGSNSIPYSSPGIQQIYRVTPEEVRDDAAKVLAVTHPEDLARFLAAIEQSAKTFQPWHCEYRIRFPDGMEKWLLGNSVPEREEDGSIL